MAKCVDCGKETPEDDAVFCVSCGAPLCPECGQTQLCSGCEELWEAEEDLEAIEEEW